MGILISFGSSGGEWVTRFPFYESGYASPSWRCCYMMAAGLLLLVCVCGVFPPGPLGYYPLPPRSVYEDARLARLAVQARALRGHKL